MRPVAAGETVLDDTVDAAAQPAWEALCPGEFERRIGRAFQGLGFAVTGFGGNAAGAGADLGLAKDGRRYLVLWRHWRKPQVSLAVVRDFGGVVAAQGASGGFLVSGGTFTREACEHAGRSRIQLIDGTALEALIFSAQF